MRRAVIEASVGFICLLIAGCGGGGGSTATPAAVRSSDSVIIHVDMTTRAVTYTSLGAPSSRAVFGSAVAPVSGPTTVLLDAGDPTIFTLNLTVTNNLGSPNGVTIGQFPSNLATVPLSLSPGVRAVLTGFSNITPAQQPPQNILVSNPDGFIPASQIPAASGSSSSSVPPAPYLVYPPIQPAGTSGSNGTITPNPNNKQTRGWNFVVPKGVTSFSFTVTLEGPVATEVPPETETSGTAATVRTFAGSLSQPGFVDGIATTGRFTTLRQVASDSAGNLYIADDHAIRRVTPAGAVNTIVDPTDAAPNTPGAVPASSGQTGTAGNALAFGTAAGIAVDAAGATIFVSDSSLHNIVRVALTGGDATKAGNWTATVIAGSTSGQAGGPTQVTSTGNTALFTQPQGLALDTAGNLYLAETGGNRVYRIAFVGPTAATGPQLNTNWTVTLLAGSFGGSPGTADGAGGAATFKAPTGIAVNQAGLLFTSDAGSNLIRQITPDGVVTTIAGTGAVGHADSGTGSSASFSAPNALATDAAGYLYLSDGGNNLVRRIAPTGTVSSSGRPIWAVATVAGAVGKGAGALDGSAITAQMNTPTGIAVDGSGNLFVTDSGNAAVRLIQRVLPGK